MKKSIVYSLAVVLAVSVLFSCNNKKGGNTSNAKLKTELDSASYAIGWKAGEVFRQSGIDKGDPKVLLNEEAYLMGLYDCMSKDSGFAIDDKDIDRVGGQYIAKLRSKIGKDLAAKTAKMFEENGKRKGVVTLKNGVQYEVVKTGAGVSPTLSDSVSIQMIMKDHTDKELQNTYKRGRPLTAVLGQIPVIGLKDVLQLMPVGTIVKMWLPAAYSYIGVDERMSQDPIYSNSYEYYEVELLKVN